MFIPTQADQSLNWYASAPIPTADCYNCGGTGYVAFMITPDDMDIEACVECGGSGEIEFDPDDGSEEGL